MATRRDKIITVLALVFTWVFIDAATANAGYIDPGSGSTLVQVLIGVAASAKRFWEGFLGLFSGSRKP